MIVKRKNRMSGGSVAAIAAVVWLLGASPGLGGAAELSLDRGSVSDLLAAALPGPFRVDAPGPGELVIHLDPPREVRFAAGGIEAAIPVRIPALGWTGTLDVRYVPDVEPLEGTVRLVAESIVPRNVSPYSPELAGWVETLDLPRRFDWELELDERLPFDLTCFVQGLRITDRRLELRLFLVTRVSDEVSSSIPEASATNR